MVRVRAKIEKNTLFGTTLVRIKSEIEKNTLFRALVGLFGRALVRAKIEKNTLFGRALVRVKGKNREKHPFWYDFS